MLTTYGDDDSIFQGIAAGARGYLLKDSDGEEIVAAVRGAVAGEVRIDPAVAGKVLQEFNRLAGQTGRQASKTMTPSPGQPPIEELTERELTVLQELTQGKTNREIAERVFLSEKTVRNYVSAILAKLDLSSRAEAAAYAVRHHILDHVQNGQA